jgi:hypothetical protein
MVEESITMFGSGHLDARKQQRELSFRSRLRFCRRPGVDTIGAETALQRRLVAAADIITNAKLNTRVVRCHKHLKAFEIIASKKCFALSGLLP